MDSKEFLDALNLVAKEKGIDKEVVCLLYTSPSPRD